MLRRVVQIAGLPWTRCARGVRGTAGDHEGHNGQILSLYLRPPNPDERIIPSSLVFGNRGRFGPFLHVERSGKHLKQVRDWKYLNWKEMPLACNGVIWKLLKNVKNTNNVQQIMKQYCSFLNIEVRLNTSAYEKKV